MRSRQPAPSTERAKKSSRRISASAKNTKTSTRRFVLSCLQPRLSSDSQSGKPLNCWRFHTRTQRPSVGSLRQSRRSSPNHRWKDTSKRRLVASGQSSPLLLGSAKRSLTRSKNLSLMALSPTTLLKEFKRAPSMPSCTFRKLRAIWMASMTQLTAAGLTIYPSHTPMASPRANFSSPGTQRVTQSTT